MYGNGPSDGETVLMSREKHFSFFNGDECVINIEAVITAAFLATSERTLILSISFIHTSYAQSWIFVFSHRLKTFGESTITFLLSWSYWRHWQSTSSWYLWWRRYLFCGFSFDSLFPFLTFTFNAFMSYLTRRETNGCFKLALLIILSEVERKSEDLGSGHSPLKFDGHSERLCHGISLIKH